MKIIVETKVVVRVIATDYYPRVVIVECLLPSINVDPVFFLIGPPAECFRKYDAVFFKYVRDKVWNLHALRTFRA